MFGVPDDQQVGVHIFSHFRHFDSIQPAFTSFVDGRLGRR